MSEVKTKLKNLRSLMSEQDVPAVALKGMDWFSWVTGGGTSVIAEVFITQDQAYVLTNPIEKDRLVAEELNQDFEVISFPWEKSSARQTFVHSRLNGRLCFSDRPAETERPLPSAFQILKMTLQSEEVARYRKIGRMAAEAMTEVLSKAQPDWSEHQLAGEGAKSLWSRGLDPTLVMVGGESRLQRYRHPIATHEKLGGCAMMAFCARSFGLFANLTRFVFFRDLTAKEEKNFQLVAQIEASVLNHTVEGQSLDSLYGNLSEAYLKIGQAEEIHNHDQGGITGYLSREMLASPESPTHLKLKTGMALAWNPSLPGAKIEDTVLLGSEGLEILTEDPNWPCTQIQGRLRPQPLIRSNIN
ncbi:MAG: M24 family metallopeptidase [Pseudobdellovibrionaceae bacterium]